MKFLVSYVSFDITVKSMALGDSSTLSTIKHEIIDTRAYAYLGCSSIRDIEAAYEGGRNYVESDDEITCPKQKIKVLMVEPIQVPWAA